MSGSVWVQPFCRVKHILSHMSTRVRVAFETYGRCHVCGTECDGGHSFPGGQLTCDQHCEDCHPAEVA
jgi:hypothetical protein